MAATIESVQLTKFAYRYYVCTYILYIGTCTHHRRPFDRDVFTPTVRRVFVFFDTPNSARNAHTRTGPGINHFVSRLSFMNLVCWNAATSTLTGTVLLHFQRNQFEMFGTPLVVATGYRSGRSVLVLASLQILQCKNTTLHRHFISVSSKKEKIRRNQNCNGLNCPIAWNACSNGIPYSACVRPTNEPSQK